MSDPHLEDFRQHLIANGVSKHVAGSYVSNVRRFLRHTGNMAVDRISEETTRAFFAKMQPSAVSNCASAVSRFLRFSATRLPVVMGKGGMLPPPAAPRSKKAVAMRDKWALEKLIDEKEKADDLIAALARRVIDHYVYFGKRLKGEPDDLDELARFADDCREIIERNLPLFMGLSAGGRNLHPKIDERVQK